MTAHHTAAKAASISLGLFFLFCLQGHLSSTFTPSFHRLIHDSAPDQVRAFWIGDFFQPSTDTYLLVCEIINAGLAASILYKPARRMGLISALGFLSVGLYVDLYTGVSAWPHVVLLGVCGFAISGC